MNNLEIKNRINFLFKSKVNLLVAVLLFTLIVSCETEEEKPKLPTPTLTQISPETGTWRDIVFIDGTNFGVDATIVDVTFQDSVAVVQRVSDNQMEVIVPEEAGTGPLTITIGENVLTSTVFTYKPFIVSGPQVSTLAGSSKGYADGTGDEAKFDDLQGVAVDDDGTIYVADVNNHMVRKITADGKVTTLAGSGEDGFADGQGAAAQFSFLTGLDVDAQGNVYVADLRNNSIRKISPDGNVITMAGTAEPGYADGPGSTARFNWPVRLTVDALGNVYVAEFGNHKIRLVTPEGDVTTIAGSSQGFADGTGTEAKFDSPHGIAIDANGTMYIADGGNNKIRKISKAGVVTTLAGSDMGFADGTGSAAMFNSPGGVDIMANGNILVADTDNNSVRMVTPEGIVTTMAGSTSGYADGSGEEAKFKEIKSVTVGSDGTIYIGDKGNQKVRKIVIVE